MVVVKSFIKLSTYEDCFSLTFGNICMERTWIKEILFNIEKGYEDVEGG